MSLSVNKRDYDIFLSHAHRDKEFVEFLYHWLTKKVGFNVWYDAIELSGGAMIASDLQTAIKRCKGMFLIASDVAVGKGWVKIEYNTAMDQKANHEDFRIVPLRINNANVEDFLMPGLTWIDVSTDSFNLETAVAIIKAFYPGEKRPNPRNSRDVYISCSWGENDDTSAIAVKRNLIDSGFRLIGDSKDQVGFGTNNRVERIISSCGALVSIIPYRDCNIANSSDKPYRYFIQEIDFAVKLGIPCLVIADPKVTRSDGSDKDWFRMETGDTVCPVEIKEALKSLWAEWISPPSPKFIFCAMDLDNKAASLNGPIRNLIERVTGIQTIIGTEVMEEPINISIIEKIRESFLIIADITDDNLNTCIEAGMGLIAKNNVAIIAQGESRRPPFMLRPLQMLTYSNDIEQIGLVHKIVWPYRRRVINAEM